MPARWQLGSQPPRSHVSVRAQRGEGSTTRAWLTMMRPAIQSGQEASVFILLKCIDDILTVHFSVTPRIPRSKPALKLGILGGTLSTLLKSHTSGRRSSVEE